MRKKLKPTSPKFLIRTAGTILSAALFAWLLSKQNWAQTWQILKEMPAWLLPVAFSLYFGSVLANTLRWFSLIRIQDVEITFWDTLKMVLAGNFASNFLPSTVGGDAVRIAGLARFSSLTLSAASTIMDRLLNIFAMLSALPFSVGVFGAFWLESWGGFGGLFPWESLSQGGALTPQEKNISGGRIFHWDKLALGVGLHPSTWRVKLAEVVQRMKNAAYVWRNQPRVLILGFALSWAGKLMIYSALWLLAHGLGMEVTLAQVIGVGAITYMLSVLPISVNGFGLREVSMTSLYIQLGATLEAASTLVVVTRFILMLETLPGALWLSETLAGKVQRKDAKKAGV